MMYEKEKYMGKYGNTVTFNPADLKNIQGDEGKRKMESFQTEDSKIKKNGKKANLVSTSQKHKYDFPQTLILTSPA